VVQALGLHDVGLWEARTEPSVAELETFLRRAVALARDDDDDESLTVVKSVDQDEERLLALIRSASEVLACGEGGDLLADDVEAAFTSGDHRAGACVLAGQMLSGLEGPSRVQALQDLPLLLAAHSRALVLSPPPRAAKGEQAEEP
jgi:hypothetical protein